METIDQPLPHLALRAVMKLNPQLQCWVWREGFWFPIKNPLWIPRYTYAVTSGIEEKPSWTPPTSHSHTSHSVPPKS